GLKSCQDVLALYKLPETGRGKVYLGGPREELRGVKTGNVTQDVENRTAPSWVMMSRTAPVATIPEERR
ncbi:MAG: hypothetical protein WBH56_15655, partial [Bacteroidota bacterium]